MFLPFGSQLTILISRSLEFDTISGGEPPVLQSLENSGHMSTCILLYLAISL